MAPIGHPQLYRYRVCKNQELWSRCTKKQVEHFTSNWDNVCPSRSTVNEPQSAVNESSAPKSWEYILCGCFIAILLVFAYSGVVVYTWKKRGSYKLSEDKDKEMITGVSYSYNRDLTDGSPFRSSVVFLGNRF